MSVNCTSSARNASCELPVASITFASPRASIAPRSARAASCAAAPASDATSSNTLTVSASTASCLTSSVLPTACAWRILASCELREPLRRGREHLVGHLLQMVVVDAAGKRVEQHGFDDLPAVAGDRRVDGRLLRGDDAPEPFGERVRRAGLVSPAQPVAVGDTHRLDD